MGKNKEKLAAMKTLGKAPSRTVAGAVLLAVIVHLIVGEALADQEERITLPLPLNFERQPNMVVDVSKHQSNFLVSDQVSLNSEEIKLEGSPYMIKPFFFRGLSSNNDQNSLKISTPDPTSTKLGIGTDLELMRYSSVRKKGGLVIEAAFLKFTKKSGYKMEYRTFSTNIGKFASDESSSYSTTFTYGDKIEDVTCMLVSQKTDNQKEKKNKNIFLVIYTELVGDTSTKSIQFQLSNSCSETAEE